MVSFNDRYFTEIPVQRWVYFGSRGLPIGVKAATLAAIFTNGICQWVAMLATWGSYARHVGLLCDHMERCSGAEQSFYPIGKHREPLAKCSGAVMSYLRLKHTKSFAGDNF
jgi:hypothetical protein